MLTGQNDRLTLAVDRPCAVGRGVSGGTQADDLLVTPAGGDALARFAL
jgi:hypothetical protein